MLHDDWIADAVEALAGEAIKLAKTKIRTPRQNLPPASTYLLPSAGTQAASTIQGAKMYAATIPRARPETVSRKGRAAKVEATTTTLPQPDNLPPAKKCASTMSVPQAAFELTGHIRDDNPCNAAGQTLTDGGQNSADAQPFRAPIGELIEHHRYRWQMIRARTRLELQAQAFCRRFCDGDKVKAGKLWGDIKKDEAHPMRVWLQPFLIGVVPFVQAQTATEKKLTKMVKGLAVYPWAKSVSGLGEISLSAIIGELGDEPTNYKSVSAIWKRMGLAVINGDRQRRVAGDAAIEHGYNPQRRSIMWNIGACLIKAQVRKDPDDEEKRIAIGDYGQVYLDRKAYEAERGISKAQSHNRAQRFMEKRLLRDLWRAWRDA
jgi:hypothetical protein